MSTRRRNSFAWVEEKAPAPEKDRRILQLLPACLLFLILVPARYAQMCGAEPQTRTTAPTGNGQGTEHPLSLPRRSCGLIRVSYPGHPYERPLGLRLGNGSRHVICERVTTSSSATTVSVSSQTQRSYEARWSDGRRVDGLLHYTATDKCLLGSDGLRHLEIKEDCENADQSRSSDKPELKPLGRIQKWSEQPLDVTSITRSILSGRTSLPQPQHDLELVVAQCDCVPVCPTRRSQFAQSMLRQGRRPTGEQIARWARMEQI